MTKAKQELQNLVKAQKQEVVDAQMKAQEFSNQMTQVNENYKLLHTEQKLLSDELTAKQNEIIKIEREKLSMERELH